MKQLDKKIFHLKLNLLNNMKDITSFCDKTEIKPEISLVYVHSSNGNKYAVATDAFRLIEWKIEDDFLKEVITDGFYNAKKWKQMCTAYNKNNRDLKTFSDLLKENISTTNQDYNYPDYVQIIPDIVPENIKDFNSSVCVNDKKFIDFINLIPKDIHGRLKFWDIKIGTKNGKEMIFYWDDTLKILLMPMEK